MEMGGASHSSVAVYGTYIHLGRTKEAEKGKLLGTNLTPLDTSIVMQGAGRIPIVYRNRPGDRPL